MAGVFLCAAVLLPADKSYAQCETATASNPRITNLIRQELNDIRNFVNNVRNYIRNDLNTAENELVDRFTEFNDNVRNALGDWWMNRFQPALEDMVAQLSTATVDQSMHKGTFDEAAGQVKAQNSMQNRHLENNRRMRIPEAMCPVASVAPAMGETEAVAKAITRVLPLEGVPRRMSQTGSITEHGRGQERNAQWQVHNANFCNPADNNGTAGCTVAGPMAGRDTDVNSILWAEKSTIDFSTAGVGTQNKLLVDTALQNMLAPVTPEPVPRSVVNTPTGQRELLKRRSLEARQRTAYTVMSRMVAERAAGRPTPEAASMRASVLSPTDPTLVSTNPSYREMMEAMTRDRHRQPDYLVKLVDDPEAVLREQGNVKGLQLQQMNELYKRLEELTVLVAAELGHELDEENTGTAIGANPVP